MQVCARAFLASGITPRCPPQVGSLPACVPQGQLSPLCSTAAAPASPQPCSCRGLAVHPHFPGHWHGCGCGGSLQPTRAAGLGGLSPVLASRDPAGAPRLGAAWSQDRPDRGSRCPSSDPIGTGVLGPRAAPPCRGRGAVAVLLRQLGGDPQPPRALVPPPALAEPGRALPGEVALLQLLPPPSPLPATAPLPKNPTGDNAS